MVCDQINFRARWDARHDLTPEQAKAVADFHNRTANQFSLVRDLALMGRYAQARGWDWIAAALLPQEVRS